MFEPILMDFLALFWQKYKKGNTPECWLFMVVWSSQNCFGEGSKKNLGSGKIF